MYLLDYLNTSFTTNDTALVLNLNQRLIYLSPSVSSVLKISAEHNLNREKNLCGGYIN